MNPDSRKAADDKSERNTDHSLGQPTKINEDITTSSPRKGREDETQRELKSCYYESVSLSGKNIPLNEEEEKTIAQCNIGDGDTLHLLLVGNTRIQVFIISLIECTYTSMIVPTSKLILHLKEDIIASVRDHFLLNDCCDQIHSQSLVLKNIDGRTELENTKILADYHKDNTTLTVDVPSYNISFLVPTCYIKMERVLFEPYNYTVLQFRNDLQRSEVKTPQILLGVIKNADGSLLYLRIDTCDMKLSIFESSLNFRQIHLMNHDTLRDIYKIIDYSTHRNERSVAVNEDYIFDAAWMRAFAPQIEAEVTAIDSYKALRLFYFPVYPRVFSRGPISSLVRIREVKDQFCRVENLQGIYQIFICESNSAGKLNESLRLIHHHNLLESNPKITLLKNFEYNRYRSKHKITVHVKWLSRERPVHIKILPDDTISTLKDLIEDRIMVPRHMQELTFSGKVITGNGTIKDVGITDMSLVVLRNLFLFPL